MATKQKLIVMTPDLSRVLTQYPDRKAYIRDKARVVFSYPSRRVFVEVVTRLIELSDEAAIAEGGINE